MLKCFDQQSGGVHIEEFDLDFNKMKTVEIQMINDEEKKKSVLVYLESVLSST